jgi:hypothetical protein
VTTTCISSSFIALLYCLSCHRRYRELENAGLRDVCEAARLMLASMTFKRQGHFDISVELSSMPWHLALSFWCAALNKSICSYWKHLLSATY